MRIEDSVFLITGGGSGLGLATARELVAQGAKVLLLDINAEAGAKAAAELGERARFLRADISSEADGRAAVEEALQAFGAVHGLVNCAGIAPAEKVLGKTEPPGLATSLQRRQLLPVMTPDGFERWRHGHVFDTGNAAGERGTRAVAWLTAAMMVVEIAAGWWFNSMALLADGFHMSSHAIAIGLSALAYTTARRHAGDHRYAFGTWKIEVLGGFASAVLLLGVVALMAFGSVERLVAPQPIHYREAIVIAVIGLLVNLVCALILGDAHHHGHDHDHDHDHDHHHHGHAHDHPHHDLNLKSAYVHVLADAATSVLAIGALVCGWLWGWSWLDPVTGLVGSVVVALWAKSLIGETSKVLLDREMDHPVVDEIREVIARHGAASHTELTDLHVWRVGKGRFAVILGLVTHDPELAAEDVRRELARHEELVHISVEINYCSCDAPAQPATPV